MKDNYNLESCNYGKLKQASHEQLVNVILVMEELNLYIVIGKLFVLQLAN